MRISTGQLLIGALVILSLAALVGGFLIIGSPAKQRLLGLDNKRIEHLYRISSAVNYYAITNKWLPASLDDLSNAEIEQLNDPETGEPYHYEVTGKTTYKLCAVFALADTDLAASPRGYNFATHAQGFHCFHLTAPDS